MKKTRGACRRWRAAQTLPSIEPNVMVVATGGDKRGVGAVTLSQREAQDAAVETERTLEVRDLQMHMTDGDFRVDVSVAHRGLLLQEANTHVNRARSGSTNS